MSEKIDHGLFQEYKRTPQEKETLELKRRVNSLEEKVLCLEKRILDLEERRR